MRKSLAVFAIFVCSFSTTFALERSFLDSAVPWYRVFKNQLFSILKQQVERREHARTLKLYNKQQEVKNFTFPCSLNGTLRSREIPKSAHKVRPGDIDVIGAIGDSLTAGFGISAITPLEVLYEDRGKSFSIGGQKTWRSYLTLPNILKLFNPKLIGYSYSSLSTDLKSQFNVAEGGAVSKNTPYMAKVLVKRILNDKRINVQKDWKMITVMIGDNDFCSEICYNNYKLQLEEHRKDLVQVLRILRDSLPRTIVNIIPAPRVDVLRRMYDKPTICKISHPISCPCIIGLTHENIHEELSNVMKKWQKIDVEVSKYSEFDLDDFTVIPHLYTLNYTFPARAEGRLDYTYLSVDCFHFSQKGHARFANDLWNSLLDPFGKKKTDGMDVFQRFNCPSEAHPFIFTRRNSNMG